MADDLASPNRPRETSLPHPSDAAGSPAHRVWGPWASLGWTVLLAILLRATPGLVAVGIGLARRLTSSQASLLGDGPLLALAIVATLPAGLALVAMLIRAQGWLPGAYLALVPPSGRAAVLGVSGLVLWLAVAGGTTIALDRPIVPPISLEAIFTTPLWLLTLAVAVALPILEEVLFRGFLYRGLAEVPRLGPGIAIGMTAIAWSAFHLQDNLFGLATVYLTGLYLGMVRHFSGSLLLTILLHCVANTVAAAEAIRFAG